MNKRGFSLIESLMAAAVFSIVAVAVVAAGIQGLRGVRQSGRWAMARSAAIMQMETLKAAQFADLLGYNGQAFAVENLPEAQGAVFVDTQGDPNLLRLTVSVALEGYSWRLVTLVANKQA